MANPWFRLYSEFADDPKVQMMSEADQRRLVMLMCSRCKGEALSEDELTFQWRISRSELEETKQTFIGKGFIDESWNLVNWESRQFISDGSAERVKRYRDKRQSSGLSRGSSHLSDPFLYERDCNRCIYCGSDRKLCIDHIHPINQGGTDDYGNLGVACKSCNSGKSGRTPEQAGMLITSEIALERFANYKLSSVTVTGTPPEQNRTDTEQTQNRTKKKQAASAFVLPPWIDREVWDSYEEMRRKIRKPMTDQARNLAVSKLKTLEAKGHRSEDVLNQSVLNSWQGLFEVRQESGAKNGTSKSSDQQHRNLHHVLSRHGGRENEGGGPGRGNGSGVIDPVLRLDRPGPAGSLGIGSGRLDF